MKKVPGKRKTAEKRVVKPPAKLSRVITPAQGSTKEADRFHAGTRFIYDTEARSLEWWRNAEFAHVPEGTFKGWAVKDAWHAKRESFHRSIEQTIGAKIATEVVKSRVVELKQLMAVRATATAAVLGVDEDGKPILDQQGNPVPTLLPKNYNEAVQALVKLDERVDEKRAVIVGDLPLTLGGGGVDGSSTATGLVAALPFSDVELRAMAHAAARSKAPPLLAPPPLEKKGTG